MTSTVLVVDDESGIRAGLATALARAGHRSVVAASLGEARARLAEPTRFDCALVDIRLKDGSGLDLLREVRAGARRELPVIVATAYDDGERVIEAMRDGAFDYLTKPFDLPRLVATVDRAVKAQRAPAAVLDAASESSALVGRSAPMLAVWKTIGRAAASRAPVLVHGEAGVGKELVARAIHGHASGDTAAAPVHAVRADAESTAATLGEALRAAPEGATVILDGVAELTLPVQAFLAAQLAVALPYRLIAQARRDRDAARPAIAPELYYPIAVLEIDVPALRDRRSDVPLLVARALAGTPARALSEEAMAMLVSHDWPGNVRELFLVVRRAAAMCRGDVIDASDLPPGLVATGSAIASPNARYLGMPLREAVASLERDLVADALRRAEGNRSLAAKILGIPRPQLYTKLEEHGMGSDRKTTKT